MAASMYGLPAVVIRDAACGQAGRWECVGRASGRGAPGAVAAGAALVRAGAAPAADQLPGDGPRRNDCRCGGPGLVRLLGAGSPSNSMF